MREASVPLTALSEAQRAQALERFAIIRPALEEGVTQAQVARTHQIAPSTVQSWIKRYREKGLARLANRISRSDKGKSPRLPTEAIQLTLGLALQTSPRSAASIHRQVSAFAKEQGWSTPSYNRVYTIIKKLDPALVTLAHRYAPEGYRAVEAALSLPAFEQKFRTWLLEDYHQRVHSETTGTGSGPTALEEALE